MTPGPHLDNTVVSKQKKRTSKESSVTEVKIVTCFRKVVVVRGTCFSKVQ